ncbi:MAG: CPBP family intramembrane glutamic endopeptidase [Planctomycetota bacterium]
MDPSPGPPAHDSDRTPFQHPGDAPPAPPAPAAAARGRRPDPGSRSAATIAWLILIPVLAAVVGLQQFAVRAVSGQIAEQAQKAVVPPTPADAISLTGRLTVAISEMLETAGSGMPEDQQRDTLESYLDALEGNAGSPSEWIRVAIVAGDVLGAEAAEDRLETAADLVEKSADQEGGASEELAAALRSDIAALRAIYNGEPLEPAQADALEAHHGWFGRLAQVYDMDDAARSPVIGSWLALLVLMLGAVAGGIVLVLVGVVLMIVLIVKMASGRLTPRFVAPAPGGSVYLETFTAFVLGFLLLQGFGVLIDSLVGGQTAVLVSLAAQWLLLPIAAWPVLRGVPWATWREQIGLVAPGGVLKEIGAGVVGYLAGLPLLLTGAGITLVLLLLREVLTGGSGTTPTGEERVPLGPTSPSNPVIDTVSGQGPVTLVLLGSLVVVWAPVVEELILRGALYRHLRAWLYWLVAAAVSAVLFGILHQYDALMLGPVIALGVTFAIVREWRGSLIGAITGHALHNGTVFVLLLTLVWLGG